MRFEIINKKIETKKGMTGIPNLMIRYKYYFSSFCDSASFCAFLSFITSQK